MGFGTSSSNFSFIPRIEPNKPLTAPKNVNESTNRLTLYVEFDTVREDGGAEISDYNIYIDDGLDGDFQGPIANGSVLRTWDSSSLTLITGLIYRVKYSTTNIHGESELSEEVSILLAEKPAAPSGLKRI
jgi:hypothetical protein